MPARLNRHAATILALCGVVTLLGAASAGSSTGPEVRWLGGGGPFSTEGAVKPVRIVHQMGAKDSAGIVAITGERGGPLRWSDWDAPTASATGEATFGVVQGRTGSTVNVVVTMTGLTTCFGFQQPFYTHYSVRLADGQDPPRDWDFSKLASGETARCQIVGGCASARSSCTVAQFSPGALRFTGAIAYRMFGPKKNLYYAHLRAWGSGRATGEAILVPNQPIAPTPCRSACLLAYPVKMTLTNLKFCENLNEFAYSRVAMTAYGSGKLQRVPSGLNYRHYKPLLRKLRGAFRQPGHRISRKASLKASVCRSA